MTETDVLYLVWIAGARAPMPQIWYGDQTKGSGQFQRGPVVSIDTANAGDLIAFNVVPDDYRNLGLPRLAEMFPAPIKKGST